MIEKQQIFELSLLSWACHVLAFERKLFLGLFLHIFVKNDKVFSKRYNYLE